MAIMDQITALQAAFTGAPEFETLKKTVDEVRKDDEAKTLFVNFREVQKKLQQKQMQGEQILEDEYLHLQKT
ncbi:MAG: YlbF family regulator, partial [Lysinibacillus sp.]